MVAGPALYVGTLGHHRYRPKAHAFRYSLFMVLVDIDRIQEMMTVSRLTSYNHFNWVSFDERDHLGSPSLPLRTRVEQEAHAQGISLPDGPIYLLTHLRYLGYAFNPISFYYCCDRAGQPRVILAEVNSTFGEQHLYWVPVPASETAGPMAPTRHRTAKRMHVSPFNTMALDYEFIITEPEDSLVAHMNTFDRAEGTDRPFFDATLTLERRPWTPWHLYRVLARHPFMTAKVIVAIHWQALRLWWKGLTYIPHPLSPRDRRTGRQETER